MGLKTKAKEVIVDRYGDLENYIDKTGSPEFVNVKDSPFNAKGDGVTDDTQAIDSALSYAESNNFGIIYFPAGTYLYNGKLEIPNAKITLKGISGGLRGSASIIKFTHSTSENCVEPLARDWYNSYRLEGLRLENKNSTGIMLNLNEESTQSIFEDLYIDGNNNATSGIYSSGDYVMKFENVNVRYIDGIGVDMVTNATKFDMISVKNCSSWCMKIEGNTNEIFANLTDGDNGGLFLTGNSTTNEGTIYYEHSAYLSMKFGSNTYNNSFTVHGGASYKIDDDGINNSVRFGKRHENNFRFNGDLENLVPNSSFLNDTYPWYVNNANISQNTSNGVKTGTSIQMDTLQGNKGVLSCAVDEMFPISDGDICYVEFKIRATREVQNSEKVKVKWDNGGFTSEDVNQISHELVPTKKWKKISFNSKFFKSDPDIMLQFICDDLNSGLSVQITDIMVLKNPPIHDHKNIPYVISNDTTSRQIQNSTPAYKINLKPLAQAPVNANSGDIAIQDGTNWNPAGTGNMQLVTYDGSSWN